MLAQLCDDPLGLSTDWDEVLAALQKGGKLVIVDLPWPSPPGQEGRHELVLERLDGDRIGYFNPAATPDMPAGTCLPAAAGVPERLVEAPGKESMAVGDLARLFREGAGCALIPV